MRKYKFRGKTPDRVQWVYGSLIILEDGDCLIKEIDYLRNICPEYRVLPDTVGQFTGLLDADGREIYEGDVIEVNRSDFIFHSVVFWYKSWYKSGFMHKGPGIFSDSFNNVTVLGNIHDNPSLLEETR